jgi:hypothetical protein
MSRSPDLAWAPSTRRRFLRMTAGFVAGWAALFRHVTMGRAVDTNSPEGQSTSEWRPTAFNGRFSLTSFPDKPGDKPSTSRLDDGGPPSTDGVLEAVLHVMMQ